MTRNIITIKYDTMESYKKNPSAAPEGVYVVKTPRGFSCMRKFTGCEAEFRKWLFWKAAKSWLNQS